MVKYSEDEKTVSLNPRIQQILSKNLNVPEHDLKNIIQDSKTLSEA